MDRALKQTSPSQVVLATLAVIAALYLLRAILVPVALALVLACILSPLTTALRRVLPLGPTGAAVVLFLLTVLCGLFVASLTAESLVQATNTLPTDIERLSGRVSSRIYHMIREHPSLQFGGSPRAAAMLASSARALAAFKGRDFVIPDDIKQLARPALRHRLVLAPSAMIEGQDVDGVLGQIIDRQAAPR